MRRDIRPILVVEDSDEDYAMLERVFRRLAVANPLHRCLDGDECLDYLHGAGRYAESANYPRPALILLDLNLPGTDGRDVLREIKADNDLRAIPVTVLTTSNHPQDVNASYHDGANCFVPKQAAFAQFQDSMRTLVDYWFFTALLPS